MLLWMRERLIEEMEFIFYVEKENLLLSKEPPVLKSLKRKTTNYCSRKVRRMFLFSFKAVYSYW